MAKFPEATMRVMDVICDYRAHVMDRRGSVGSWFAELQSVLSPTTLYAYSFHGSPRDAETAESRSPKSTDAWDHAIYETHIGNILITHGAACLETHVERARRLPPDVWSLTPGASLEFVLSATRYIRDAGLDEYLREFVGIVVVLSTLLNGEEVSGYIDEQYPATIFADRNRSGIRFGESLVRLAARTWAQESVAALGWSDEGATTASADLVRAVAQCLESCLAVRYMDNFCVGASTGEGEKWDRHSMLEKISRERVVSEKRALKAAYKAALVALGQSFPHLRTMLEAEVKAASLVTEREAPQVARIAATEENTGFLRLSVKGAIVQDGKLLLVEYDSPDAAKLHYNLPGGRVRLGETLREAMHRKVLEETGVDVKVGRLLFGLEYVPAKWEYEFGDLQKAQFIFECVPLPGARVIKPEGPGAYQTGVRWLTFDEVRHVYLTHRFTTRLLDALADPQRPDALLTDW